MVAKITITGHIGADSEERQTSDGTPVANFPVYVNRGKDQPPTIFRVAAFGARAGYANKHCTSGASVMVIGDFQANPWERDGKSGIELKVTADHIEARRKPDAEEPEAG